MNFVNCFVLRLVGLLLMRRNVTKNFKNQYIRYIIYPRKIKKKLHFIKGF